MATNRPFNIEASDLNADWLKHLPAAQGEIEIHEELARRHRAEQGEWVTIEVKQGHFVTIDDKPVFVGGPGQGGGSASGGSAAPSAGELAKGVRQKAERVEPEITEIVTSTVKEGGGEMEGLQYRLKSEESLERKIKSDAEEKGLTESEAAARITDSVRYTAVFGPDELVAGADRVQEQLAEQGYERYDHKWKNYFGEKGAYRGYNTVYVNSKTGQKFELQFHTRESLQRKEKVHKLYEEARVLPKGPKRTQLYQQMEQMWEGFQNPTGYDGLEGVVMNP